MKRLFATVVLSVGLVAGLLYVGLTPRAPLAVAVIGVTNRVTAGLAARIVVANQTYRHLRFNVMMLTLSNGVWASPHADYTGFGGKGFVGPRASIPFVVQTHETPSVVRFRIQYWRNRAGPSAGSRRCAKNLGRNQSASIGREKYS